MTNQNLKKKQNHVSSKKQKNNHVPEEIKKLYLIPIIFIIAVLPLIMKIHVYPTKLTGYEWFKETDTYYFDYFLYYKQVFFIVAVIFMFIVITYKAVTDRKTLKFEAIFIPLAVYTGLSLLSSLFSEYRAFCFTGIFEQFESVFVLLGYCCTVYYTYLFLTSERDIKYMLYALLISSIILGLIGLSQVLDHDFYNTQTGWSLISGAAYRNNRTDFTFTAGLNRVYLSLYNPNYVGVYTTLILPIFFFMIIFIKKLWLRIAFAVALTGLIISLYGSLSTSGFIGVIASVLLSLVLLWRYIIKYFYISIPVVIVVIISLFIANYKFDNYISNQINKITNIHKSTSDITEIQTNDDNIIIKYKGNTLRATFTVDQTGFYIFNFTDENNNPIPSTPNIENGQVTIDDSRFPGFIFSPFYYGEDLSFSVTIAGSIWNFTNQVLDRTYYFINPYGRYVKMESAPSAVFTGYEAYASGRGYIWSRTIPLLKNKIIFGSGADTFLFEFPQRDYVNLINYGFTGQLMSKPHCLYLQIATQTGVISLIAFLVFYIMYFISSIRLYIKGNFSNLYSVAGAGIFTGSFGYMICGISNDSSITVAPIFWVLIGAGIIINKEVKKCYSVSNE